ncbi:alpha/beta fold hydrolase [Pseudooceanicola sp. C21-150M6]|uniref:alpha/beta fold hydrolase n=1 Tax=Pseudooceanicola sp. C21-150M6 TaxID=3434355 RepID=UPI003D7FA509
MLRMIRHDGPTDQPPLIIAHGLFGSGRNWGVIAKRLSGTRKVIAVDMRNHGESPRFDTNSYTDMAGDLAEVIAATGPAHLLGHSMGGKAAMAAALLHPAGIESLIVADIAPVGYAHSQSDKIDAMEAVDLGTISRRSEAAEALAGQGIDPALQSFFTQSLDIQNRRWRFNLPVLRDEMDKIIGFPDLAGQFARPALFLAGADSDYVTREARPKIQDLFPAARFAKIPGAGHWLHADKPREFVAAVDAFLSAVDQRQIMA